MNIVQKFKQKRNLSKFLNGGSVPKLQMAWQPLYTDQQRAAVEWGRQNKERTSNQISSAIKQADERIAQRQKAYKRANRKTKAPMINNTAKLQEALYKAGFFDQGTTFNKAVDGDRGGMTDAAIQRAKDAGYNVNIDAGTINKVSSIDKQPLDQQKPVRRNRFITTSGSFAPSQVIEQSTSSVTPYMEEAADFVGHNPALILAEDMDKATPNRITEALFGIRPFKGKTITNLPSLQKQELINQVKFAKERGYNSFTSDLYNQMYNYNYGSRTGVGGEDRSGLWARMNTPRARLEHTLGQYNFYTDENGNTIVTDIYDFNDDQKQRGDGKYANIRNGIAVTYGSRSSEPNEGKIKYKINLGKI